MSEIWKSVVGFEGLYEVSDLGRVRNRHGKVLQHSYVGKYPHLPLRKNGRQYGRLIHRAVLEAFKGPCPKEHEGAHDDGDPENNKLGNLFWKTRTANALDKHRHGTMMRGETHPNADLSDRQVAQIRRAVAEGATQAEAGRPFRKSQAFVSQIVSGKRRAA